MKRYGRHAVNRRERRMMVAGVSAACAVGLLAGAPIGAVDGTGPGASEASEAVRLASELTVDEAFALADRLIADGNSARAAEVMSEAAGVWEDARLVARGRLAAGRAWVQAGRYDEGIEALRAADLGSDEASVRTAARFLIGQARYGAVRAEMAAAAEEGRPVQPGELRARAGLLDVAADSFRSALDVDAGDGAAARNVERLRLLAQAMRDEADAEEERQEQREALQEALEELADEQERRAEESQASDGSDQEQLQDGQRQTSERTERAVDEASQAEAGDEAEEALRRARDEQAEAERALEEGDLERAEEAQRRAAEALREAAEATGEQGEPGGEGEDSEDGEPQDGEGEEEGEGEPTEEEGEQRDETAEALLERERREREARERQLRSVRGRPVIVERDW